MPLIPQRVHFVGIGGVGMSAIARVLLDFGTKVSGSDLKKSPTTDRLQALGARVYYGHAPENLGEAELVVISAAVRPDNPEVVAARRRGLPVVPRAEMLARLMRRQRGIAIAGAHGKTTTTAMVAHLLLRTGFDPTILIGGDSRDLGENARTGRGEYLVAEADESDGSFLLLNPEIIVVTNVENDHLDYYQTVENIERTFSAFIGRVPSHGLAVLCHDDPFLRRLALELRVPVLTYGTSPDADYVLAAPRVNGVGTWAEVYYGARHLGRLELLVPGMHNLKNALAATAVGLHLGLEFAEIAQVLASFHGVKRRFELIGEAQGVRIVDDYAHHPTEIAATLAAARHAVGGGRVIAVFQPHRYSRTLFLHEDFGRAFGAADLVFLNGIYGAGEAPIKGVSAAMIADAVGRHRDAVPPLYESREELVEKVAGVVRKGDLVLTMGAGDIWKAGVALLEKLGGKR
ncbi:MAG: UDP-N-acetylmuramate--L-alanine ligase [Thermoanaerobacterales bacterium]|nr:UDP-N-acetylmuramate--L-alanine ligase [Thermoanaerobacterales bacterium]